jgi:hypothetical protein
MGFDGASATEPLDYKGLAEFGIPDGTIAEPTNERLVAFFDAIGELAKVEGESGTDLLARVQQATSDLCSGTPSAEQFAALPPRLFREFIKWLAGEFTNPKG